MLFIIPQPMPIASINTKTLVVAVVVAVVVVVVIVVVIVIEESMLFGVRESPGRYDSRDYDNDNDKLAWGVSVGWTSAAQSTSGGACIGGLRCACPPYGRNHDPRKSGSHTETQRSQRFSKRYVGRGGHPGGDRTNACNDLFLFVFFVSLCEQFPDLG